MVRLSVLSVALLSLALVEAGPAAAQSAATRNGPRPVLPRAAEVALARSAAPASISDGSRVWAFTGTTYVVADSGQTGVNCYVGRPWSGSLEPHCFDAEGAATVLPIQIRRIELYAAGRTETAVEAEIAQGILSGRFRLPSRSAVTYMMSAAQNLVTGPGTPIGAWRPHLMIYQPFVTAEAVGLAKGGGGVMLVENSGMALAALIIPLEHFVPAPDSTRR